MNSEKHLGRELSHAWVCRLASSERPECAVVVQFVECADLVCSVDGPGADALFFFISVFPFVGRPENPIRLYAA